MQPSKTSPAHTAGPWEIEERDSRIFVEVEKNDDESQWTVAECLGSNAEANARVIAAAPALVDALEAYVDYDDVPEGEEYEAIRLAARDAIAQAYGKAA